VDEVVGAGWDPRVADPRGRALSVQLKYKFL
jgi:iron complex outermembrane receptor protein